MQEIKRYHIIFKGIVQGVGFRYTLLRLAKGFNIVGSCRNLFNGDVEAFIQGDKDALNILIKEILKNPGCIVVEDYAIKEKELTNDRDFVILY